MGQVIAVTSGKGGTGKTTVSAAISCCLAAEGYKVLCIDADVGLRNLDISLGMADMAPISFADVLARRYTLDDATPHPQIDGLYLLTAPVIDRPEAISFQAFGQMLQAVRARFDFCVIDTQAGLGDGFQLLARVDQLAVDHRQAGNDRGGVLYHFLQDTFVLGIGYNDLVFILHGAQPVHAALVQRLDIQHFLFHLFTPSGLLHLREEALL